MPHAYQIHKQDAAYFLTLTAVEWADVFLRREHKQILCDSLNFCVNVKGLEIFAYVIMTSHVHLIARAKEGNLSEIIRDFKKFTSAMLLRDFVHQQRVAEDGCWICLKKAEENKRRNLQCKFGNIIIMRWRYLVRNLL